MGPPSPLLVETARTLKPGRALDLACGTGRNAIWLAEHGWKVTAVDRSPITIPMIDTHVADLEKHEFTIAEASWDLIVVCLYLQRDLFEPVKRGIKPGGVALVIVHLIEPRHELSRFSVQPGELIRAIPIRRCRCGLGIWRAIGVRIHPQLDSGADNPWFTSILNAIAIRVIPEAVADG